MNVRRRPSSLSRRAREIPAAFGLLGALGAASLALASGCGGEAPAAPPANAPTKAIAAAPATPPADVTAVPEPANLVLLARVAKPSATLGVVVGWLKGQLPGVPEPGSDVVTELIAGESVGEIVDLDQPIDMAAVASIGMRPKGAFAVSAAVKDPARAKATFSSGSMKLVPGENGMLRIDGLGPPVDQEDDDDMERRTCALVPAYGVASMRLVCGFGAQALATLAPYLTRTAPRLPSASDMHLELRFGPAHSFIETNRRAIPIGLPMLLGSGARNPALLDLATALANEAADLALDLETLSLDAKISDGSADGIMTTKLRGSSSLVARVATANADRIDVPPPAFLHLPVDAEVALFHRGLGDKDLDHPRELLANLAAQELVKDGLASADAKAFTDALGKVATTAPVVYAAGVDAVALEKALTSPTDPAKGTDAQQAPGAWLALAREALVGWRIVGIEEPPARLTAAVKDVAATFNRPGFLKWVKAQNKLKPATTLKIVPPPAAKTGLPKDTVHAELTVYPDPPAQRATSDSKRATAKPAPPAKPLRLHAYVVPDGTRTWLAFGASDELVVARAKAVLDGAPEAGTLAKRQGLEGVRDQRMNAGGFFTLEGAVTSVMAWRSVERLSPTRAAQTFGAVTSGAGKGMTPLPFAVTIKPAPAGAAGGTTVASVRVPRAAIEDILKTAMRGGLKL